MGVQLSGVIKANQNLSTVYQLPGEQIVVNVIMPAAWTSGNLTFQGSRDGITFNNLYDDEGNELTVTAAASRYIAGALKLAGIRYLKIRSGTSAATVPQAADRTIYLDIA